MTETVPCRLATDDEPACTLPAVVRIEDATGGSEAGCRQHGIRALRGIRGGKVYPLPGHDGEAIAVYNDAVRR